MLVSERPSPVFGVADRFVRRWAELEPTQGLTYGLAGTPGRLSDWSPQGRARVADALRHGLAELDRTPPRDGADRRAAAVMRDRLEIWLASATAQDWARELDAGFLAPPAMDRIALATAPLAVADDAELLGSRLSGVPDGMQGYAAALRVGLDEGRPGAGVLAERLVAMLRASARSDGGYFAGLAAKAAALAGVDTRTARHLHKAGRAADGAYDQLADWLEHEYLPRAAPDPAVGPERYERALHEHLGLTADPVELAAWGWEELDRLEREMRREAAAGWPGLALAEVLDRLDHDPDEPSAAGPAELLDWLGQLDQQVARRLGEEFDIPPQLSVLRHELAPPGSAAGAYYLPPTEDGARPGMVIWTMPAGRVPLWRWQTFSHHEGMPGHHLELGGVRLLPVAFSRFQTGLGEISGYRPSAPSGSGSTPDSTLACASRPASPTRPPVRSSPLRSRSGCPAQAVAYKIGEREWLRVRAQARQRIPGLTNRQSTRRRCGSGPCPSDSSDPRSSAHSVTSSRTRFRHPRPCKKCLTLPVRALACSPSVSVQVT